MNRMPLLASLAIVSLAGCAANVPYRDSSYAEDPSCRKVYEAYDARDRSAGTRPEVDAADPCWRRANEEHDDYDLLFVEFDDQGWVQGSSDLSRPGKSDHLDALFDKLKRLYDANLKNGLSLVVYIHGWHHNAGATDPDVTEFRRLLRDVAIAERGRKSKEEKTAKSGPRVVGIYLGWRGESITMPLVRQLTFWERKNTAERVAQGSVREFFARMDLLRDRGRSNVKWESFSSRDRAGDGERNVRMLTIGHSFGGLITLESLSGEFVRVAVRSTGEDYVSRLGDLVVIVNPAVEGARYEPLMVAGHRMRDVKKNQLPVVIVATSTADWATGVAFPLAREFSTILEKTPGAEGDAIVKAVGHNERYITHRLGLCSRGDAACANVCESPQAKSRESAGGDRAKLEQEISAEYRHVRVFGQKGFGTKESLCGGMQLESTKNQAPPANPFWVVSTTRDIMKDHGDIFNARFVSFIRQMYLSVIAVRFPERD